MGLFPWEEFHYKSDFSGNLMGEGVAVSHSLTSGGEISHKVWQRWEKEYTDPNYRSTFRFACFILRFYFFISLLSKHDDVRPRHLKCKKKTNNQYMTDVMYRFWHSILRNWHLHVSFQWEERGIKMKNKNWNTALLGKENMHAKEH
jgi:hypothetical protein